MKKIKKHITSEEEKRLIGHLVKKKKKSGKAVNVYFNKRVESTGKTKYVSGSFYSKKNNASYTYRSSYELMCFIKLEQNPDVIQYLSETMSIPYIDSKGLTRKYIPDLLVLFADGSMCIWEIKPLAMLKDADVKAKAAACKKHLRDTYKERNIKYEFITENKLFKNAKEYTDFLNSIKGKDFSKKNAHSFSSETL